MSPGPRVRRIVAALIDLPLSLIAMAGGGALATFLLTRLDRAGAPDLLALIIGFLVVVGAHAAYYVVSAVLYGASTGKLVVGLRLVDAGGGPPSLRTAAVRYAGQWASMLTLGVGHAICLFRADGKSLQDLLAGTRVARSGGSAEPVAGPLPAPVAGRVVAVAAAGLAVWIGGVVLGTFNQLLQSSKEGATKGNLAAIRSAISIYYGDTEGRYPGSLSTAPDSVFSRYLETIPPVTATHAGIGRGRRESPAGADVTCTLDETITVTGRGWRYSPKTGHLFVNSCATDIKGLPYSCYGY